MNPNKDQIYLNHLRPRSSSPKLIKIALHSENEETVTAAYTSTTQVFGALSYLSGQCQRWTTGSVKTSQNFCFCVVWCVLKRPSENWLYLQWTWMGISGTKSAKQSWTVLVSYPARWSFSFTPGRLHWSSSWQWQLCIAVCRLFRTLLLTELADFAHFFAKCIFYVCDKAAKFVWCGFSPQKQPGKLTLGVFRIYWVTQ